MQAGVVHCRPLLRLTLCFFLVLRGMLLPPLRLLSPTCRRRDTSQSGQATSLEGVEHPVHRVPHAHRDAHAAALWPEQPRPPGCSAPS